MTNEQIKAEVSQLRQIQKTHKPNSSAWMMASELLAPLFAEMAKRANGKAI